jgi:hypothetical protein
VTTLPFDFDIFLRSGSSTQPEMAVCAHGSESCSSSARSTVVNSQVRMMSCACGRSDIGNTCAKRSASRPQPATICGVSDDVAQVSMMSRSPTKPFGWPRCACVNPSGTSVDGSIGRRASSGSIGAL